MLVTLVGISAFSEDKVTLSLSSTEFQPFEVITVTVTNPKEKPISLCLEAQWFTKPDGEIGIAHTPFVLQLRKGRKWQTQINGVTNGVDVGKSTWPILIAAHSSAHFEFQTDEGGEARLFTYYRLGKNKHVYSDGGGKKVTSGIFILHSPSHRIVP